MPGLVPRAIHVFLFVLSKDVDGRDKPGHDDRVTDRSRNYFAATTVVVASAGRLASSACSVLMVE